MRQKDMVPAETREEIAYYVASGKALRAKKIREKAATLFQWVASLWRPKSSRRILPRSMWT